MLKVVTEKLGAVTVLRLRGRVAISQAKILLNTAFLQSDAGVVVLDLARVTGVDAHGLSVLLQLREKTRSMGIELKLMNLTKLVRHVLEITCLDSVFEVISGSDVFSRAFPNQPVNQSETGNRVGAQG